MIVALAASEAHLKSPVDPHFGRCDWFCLYDTSTLRYSFIENPVRYQHEMAGHDAADFLIKKGISVAVAGRFGSRVIDIFRANNVQMIIPENQQLISDIINSLK